MKQTARLGRVLYTPAAVVALITGLWLVVISDFFTFDDVFVALGIAMVVIGAVLGMRVFGPGGREAASLHEAGDATGAAAVHSRLFKWALVDSALLVVTIYAMVEKIGAGG